MGSMLTAGFAWAGYYAAVLLTMPAALLLLWLYRRAVVRAMRGPGAEPVPAPAEPAPAPPAEAAAPLRLEQVDVSGPGATGDDGATRRAVAITAVSGAAFAALVSAGWLLTLGSPSPALWIVWWLVLQGWPALLACGITAGATGSDWLRLAGGYLAAVAAISGICLGLYEGLTLRHVLVNAASILLIAVPAGALVVRRVRAVGLLVFLFLLSLLVLTPPFATGVMLLMKAVFSEAAPVTILLARTLLLFGDAGVVVMVVAAGLFAAVLTGYAMLRGVGLVYRRKWVSDESLLLAALWPVVAISHVLVLSTQGDGSQRAWIAAPAAALVACCGLQWGWTLWRARRRAARAGRPPLLLLLRVFALGQRSERLFDVLASRWLRRGPIAFIAGPDLAAGTVAPSQFLAFTAGRLARQFVADPAQAARRAAELDLLPDADGRYRVNQLYCAGETWKDAVLALARRSDLVLMDLRGFSASNAGCLHELEMLLRHVPIGRVRLVVDGSSDWPFLEATLQRLWQGARPKAELPPLEALVVFRLRDSSPRALRAVAARLTQVVGR